MHSLSRSNNIGPEIRQSLPFEKTSSNTGLSNYLYLLDHAVEGRGIFTRRFLSKLGEVFAEHDMLNQLDDMFGDIPSNSATFIVAEVTRRSIKRHLEVFVLDAAHAVGHTTYTEVLAIVDRQSHLSRNTATDLTPGLVGGPQTYPSFPKS